MKNRLDIKNFIVNIEQNFPVNNWKFDDVHIWPYIRIKLFFHLINQIENKTQKENANNDIDYNAKEYSTIRVFLFYIREYLKSFYKLYINYYQWFKKLPRKDYVFFGADSHRVNYKGKRFNRYFDVWIDKNRIKDKSIFFEYDLTPISNQYNLEIIYKYQEAFSSFQFLQKFKKRKKSYYLQDDGYNDFLKFIINNKYTKTIEDSLSKENLNKWYSESFHHKIVFFTKILNKIKPKEIHILCYYSEDIMGLLVAANQLGIETIEMQHGPQTAIHLAYGSWTSIPSEGYKMLPNIFWCWDKDSNNVIDDWTKKTNKYRAIVTGNPWVDYWKGKRNDCQYKDYILYSLQPFRTIEELFPAKIIKFIKLHPYKWFVRLHPRQYHEKENLMSFIKRHNVEDKVNIEDATDKSLPLLLMNAIIHITNFSGVTIEASLFNKKTVVIDEIGLMSFPELIEKGKVIYIDRHDVKFSYRLINIIKRIEE